MVQSGVCELAVAADTFTEEASITATQMTRESGVKNTA